jgi:hypothetical protein
MSPLFVERPAESRSADERLILDLLRRRDLETLSAWAGERRGAERILNRFLYHDQDLIRWRTIEAFGRLARLRAEKGLDGVRSLIRRFLWAMNDESGNSLWHAPELIGEMLSQVPALIPEFAPTIPAQAGDPRYRRGAHWAMARVAGVDRAAFDGTSILLRDSLHDDDAYVRGMAAQALSPRAAVRLRPELERLQDDGAVLDWYDAQLGDFRPSTVGDLVRKRLAQE